MKMVIDWKTGEPEKDGVYYTRRKAKNKVTGEEYWDIHMTDYTVRWGWYTVKEEHGYWIPASYDPAHKYDLQWSEVEVIEG